MLISGWTPLNPAPHIPYPAPRHLLICLCVDLLIRVAWTAPYPFSFDPLPRTPATSLPAATKMFTGEGNGSRLPPAGKSNTAGCLKILTIHRNALIHQGKDPSLTVRCTDLFRNQQWAEYLAPRDLLIC